MSRTDRIADVLREMADEFTDTIHTERAQGAPDSRTWGMWHCVFRLRQVAAELDWEEGRQTCQQPPCTCAKPGPLYRTHWADCPADI